MSSQHYRGLIAEWYDDWLKDRTDDIDYYRTFFSGFSGRVLELACGSGRLLLPILKSGVSIDGLDSSVDMLNVLRRKAADQGIPALEIYQQPMQAFNLPMKYDAILIATGSFQLLTEREQALNALRCVHAHLNPGGFFLVDLFVPWDDILTQHCDAFRIIRDAQRPDGTRSLALECFTIDLVQQIKRGIYRYEVYQDTRLTDCVMDDLSIRWYWKDEFLNLLSQAGFSHSTPLTDSPLYEEGHTFVFQAFM